MANEPDDLEKLFEGITLGDDDADLISAFASKDELFKPDEPDELDLGAFDHLPAGNIGAPMQFLQNLLGNCYETWRTSGNETYVCVLNWTHNRVTTDDVERFVAALRMSYSRFKHSEGRGLSLPKLVMGEYQILADRRNVLFEMHIMNEEHWYTHNLERTRIEREKRPSRQQMLNGFLKTLMKP